jgi:hypothetical protein
MRDVQALTASAAAKLVLDLIFSRVQGAAS